jgi:hypothetical protein
MIFCGFTSPMRLNQKSQLAQFLWDHPTPPEENVGCISDLDILG